MAELLLELASEEIPARMQARAADDLKRLVADGLAKAGLSFALASAFATPRRLALVVKGLPKQQPDTTEERKGPKVGAPPQAVAGFLKAAGLASAEEAEVRETDKGQIYFAVRSIKGQATAEVLPGLVVSAIQAMSWPKSMRWAEGTQRWVRPLHGILAIFDGQPLAGALPLGKGAELAFSKTTSGHQLMGAETIEPTDFTSYRTALAAAHVVLDGAARKAAIMEQAEAAVAAAGLRLRPDPGLLDEVTGLVEWPVALIGAFDPAFLEVPEEILVTSMRSHQKYFALEDAAGRLANRFLLVANVPAPAGSARRANIIAGNERVLRARLSDAKFFWDQDRKVPLSDRVPALKDIVFHAKLGTMDRRVDRIEALALNLATQVPGTEREQVRAAARLCKADLTTGVVGEFPELQGLMGSYYARHDREPDAVAQAIAEHYAPKGPDDACPTAPVSVCVALAEKLDTLVGFWAIDEKPTGSKDPFALRRAALGVIRLIVENRLSLPLTPRLKTAAAGYGSVAAAFKPDDLLLFFADRLKVALKDRGVRHDLVSAIFALGGEDDLLRLLARVEALQSFVESDDGANLLVAYRRAANIVRIEEKKDGKAAGAVADQHLFQQHEEQALWQALQGASSVAKLALGREDFAGAKEALAALRAPTDAFFDKVMVNAPEPALRANRLALLKAIQAALDQIARFDLVEG